MNEKEWLQCTDPTPMLKFLRGKASDRKVQLFACACLRRIWRLLPDEPCQNAVQTFEQFADRLSTEEEFARAKNAADYAHDLDTNALVSAVGKSLSWFVESVEYERDQENALAALWWSASNAAHALGCEAAIALERKVAPELGLGEKLSAADYRMVQDVLEIAEAREKVGQADMLRCIVGNPFRLVTINPTWLTWNDATVRRIAQGIYEERRLPEGTLDHARLAILHDALLDAGCSDEELLTHLRSEGPHVLGCWPVDMLLGKA